MHFLTSILYLLTSNSVHNKHFKHNKTIRVHIFQILTTNNYSLTTITHALKKILDNPVKSVYNNICILHYYAYMILILSYCDRF